MITVLFIVFLVVLTAATIRQWRRGEGLEMLPSLCWALFMVIPFYLQQRNFFSEKGLCA